MIVKVLHTIGLTNLSDADVKKYYQTRATHFSGIETDETRKTESILKPVFAALLIALVAGSSAPWWLPELKSLVAFRPHSSQFRLIYPISDSVVPTNIIMLRGVGALRDDNFEVEVFTNDWYPQTGQAKIDPDGSWTYGPCYLSGQGAFNNHTIRVTLIRNGVRVASAIATGIRRS